MSSGPMALVVIPRSQFVMKPLPSDIPKPLYVLLLPKPCFFTLDVCSGDLGPNSRLIPQPPQHRAVHRFLEGRTNLLPLPGSILGFTCYLMN